MMAFADRSAAGRELAGELEAYAGRDDAIVLGLARGGVPVAYEVARALRLPLDVLSVRKLGVPGHEELAMGAIASGGVRVLNDEVVARAQVDPDAIDEVAEREQRELDRRERAYRDGGESAPVERRTAILVDDGLATGASMRAAVHALRRRDVKEIVVAVPIAPPSVCDDLRRDADAVVCARTPEPFGSVGQWYAEFEQTDDDEVRRLLADAS
jgi:predicted phosphoribosyltransferase